MENQTLTLGARNAWSTDAALRDAVLPECGGWAAEAPETYDALAGGELVAQGFLANENKPKLRTFDRYGRRVDEVEFPPS